MALRLGRLYGNNNQLVWPQRKPSETSPNSLPLHKYLLLQTELINQSHYFPHKFLGQSTDWIENFRNLQICKNWRTKHFLFVFSERIIKNGTKNNRIWKRKWRKNLLTEQRAQPLWVLAFFQGFCWVVFQRWGNENPVGKNFDWPGYF